MFRSLRRRFVRHTDQSAIARTFQARQTLLADPRYADPLCLMKFGRKVYSQNDEDGIIAEIFRRIGTESKRFVEIGSGDGRENNTLALILQGWSGGWIDGDPENARRIRACFAPLLDRGQLTFVEGFVTKESVASLIDQVGSLKEIDLFSIDIDGNDFHILETLDLNARLVVVEYNGKFAPPIEWIMPYDPDHVWDGTDYCSASLSSFERLMRAKGYSLVGCNITGINAFFVRSDLAEGKFLAPFTAERHFEECRYWMTPGFVPGNPFGLRLK
jgi:hypothetical protein